MIAGVPGRLCERGPAPIRPSGSAAHTQIECSQGHSEYSYGATGSYGRLHRGVRRPAPVQERESMRSQIGDIAPDSKATATSGPS